MEQEIPFEYNFAWRMEPGAGLGTIVTSMSHQTGGIYPYSNIAYGQAKLLRRKYRQ